METDIQLQQQKFQLVLPYNPKADNELMITAYDILSMKADEGYCKIVYNDAEQKNKELVPTHQITYYVQKWQTRSFFRIHRAYLINKLHTKAINHSKHFAVMKNDFEITCSRKVYEQIKHLFPKL
jgi:DNA-binding LytR/AlgR family response regulator